MEDKRDKNFPGRLRRALVYAPEALLDLALRFSRGLRQIAFNLPLLAAMSWRNLHRQKRRSALVISAAAAGMLGVILNLGLINGLGKMWVEGGIESGLGHAQIRPVGYKKTRKINARFDHPEIVSKYVAGLDKTARPPAIHAFRFERAGFIRLGAAMQGVQFIGVEPESEKNISKFDDWIIKGTYLGPVSARDRTFGVMPVLIGKANAEKFEVGVGDSVVISIGARDSSTKSVRARVQGIYQSIAEPVDKYTALVLRKDLSRLYSGKENELSYAIFLGKHRRFAEALKKKLSEAPGAPEADYMTYKELQPGITYLMEFWDSLVLILYLIMLMGFALVLLNSILMSVFERTREIGILRALGSSGSLVFSMVILESVLLGLLGCVAGIVVGGGVILILNQTGFSFTMFAKGMEMMGGAGTLMYPSLTLKDIAVGLSAGLIISALASLYPAYKAVRMQPIKAIYSR